MLQKFEFYSIFVIIFTVGVVFCATSDVKEESDRGAHSDRGGLWFGPRLGKRSLKLPNEDNRDIFFKLLEAADALKYYYDQVPESYLERRNDPDTRVAKKVIFTPKLGRSLGEDQERQFVDFTPRLGRRLAEELSINTPTDQEIYSSDGDRIGTRTRYFSPRLGRTMSFSPRLGRELSYDNSPDQIRIARSTNNTKKH